jgi:exopolyphosphatase/guanosine-5'-triphosphate,3'-diphosphate pyrophosphatase
MSRFAAIDVGTNSVLLLVAEKRDGRFVAVLERSEITRLGKGVDQSKQLAPESIETTLSVIERFAREARDAGAQKLVVSATSAARDASNGHVFLNGAKARAGVDIEIISGDEEARLSFASAWSDFGGAQPLVVLDIGGGSTEFIFGDAKSISYRHSFDVGAVRMTERHIHSDPPSQFELEELDASLAEKFADVPTPPANFRMVGVAGTVTTLAAVVLEMGTYDPARIHGSVLSFDKLAAAVKRLETLPVHLRKTVAGVQEKRADVIVAGGRVLLAAMKTLGVKEITVSDRGLRWGLLADRFGGNT